MNSLVAALTALLLWLSPAESDTRFTKYKISSTEMTYGTSSTSYVDVTNGSVSIKTTGRPIVVGMTWGGTQDCYVNFTNASVGNPQPFFRWVRDSTTISVLPLGHNGPTTSLLIYPCSAFTVHDFGTAAGTYTYKIQVKVAEASTTLNVRGKVFAYELP